MDIIDFVKQFPVKTFQKGDILLHAGDTSDRLFAITQGYIKVTALHENGAEQLIWVEGRYDVAPTEHWFSASKELSFYYTAISDGSYYEIDKRMLLQHANNHPELMSEIARSMSQHYDDLLQRISAIGQPKVRERLIATLCYIGERFSAEEVIDLYQLGLKLTHSDWAAMVSSTRETVSLEFAHLMKEGLVDYDRNKCIINLPLLRELL